MTKKCNLMREYFDQNRLKLSLKKSGYLIINGKRDDEKCTLILNKGCLRYKEKLKYLGIIISDSGSIKKDIRLNLLTKRKFL